MTSSVEDPQRTRAAVAVPAFALSAAGVVLVAHTMRQAVAGVPPLLERLDLGGAAASLLVTIPVLCFAIGALAGPALRRRFGEERAVFGLMAGLLVGLLLRAVSPEWALFAGTIVGGFAVAVLNVLIPSLIKHRFPNRVGAMMAAYTMAITVGASLAAGVTVPVLHAADDSTTWALAVWGIPAAVALLAWLPQLRVGPAEAETGTARPRSLWRDALAWNVMAFMGLVTLIYYACLSWLPAFYTDRGVDEAQAGFLLMVMNLTGLLGNLVAPTVAERMRDQRVAVAATVATATVGVLGIWLAPTSTALVWVTLFGISQGAALSLALLLMVLRAPDSDAAARLSSMAQAGGYLIGAAGPLVMGLLYTGTGGWTAPMVFLLATTLLGLPPGLAAGRNVRLAVR
ncbi:MAG: major facilitator superfamily 1 [Cryptosporangiaceae bacterium]|jgi:CP family cyanate transporter-like MFS transporter|nr:major facilitator superfamily 1 [Cryptosporangiaceae bacterium]